MPPILDPMAWKEDIFQHGWDDLSIYAFSPFTLLRLVLLRVMLSQNLTKVLVTPLWRQKEWSADLLDPLVEVPLELPMLWNLLVQPHIKKIHQGWGFWGSMPGNYQVTHTQGTIFLRRLQRLTSSDLRKTTACLCQGMWSKFPQWWWGRNIASCTATVQQLFSFYLHRKLKLTVSAIKGYRSTHNHVFTLLGSVFTSSSIINRMFCNFKKSFLPR